MPNSRVRELIDAIADAGSFKAWSIADLGIPASALTPYVDAGYREALDDARAATGSDEAVVVGRASVEGRPVCFIFGDFQFLAGSVGRLACQLVLAATARAAELSLPVLAAPASGGTRMQEGTPAFVLMADVAAALARYRNAGLPWITWLRHPTTGGVMATWGSLGTLTFGEPGALAGFLGPRVFSVLNGVEFPADVQTSDNLARVGVIDGVRDAAEIRVVMARILALQEATTGADQLNSVDPDESPTDQSPTGWQCVVATRNPNRPTAGDVLDVALSDAVEISGTGEGERSGAVKAFLGRWSGQSCVVVAQDRRAQTTGEPLNPAALRTARRAFRLAIELDRPLVTIVDTAGAELSVAAEEGALAGEIARCLADLSTAQVPTLSILLGMGCGGGALAMLPADRVVAAAHGWVSPLPLEGASIIRYRSVDHAEEMATAQKISATELVAAGIVDAIVAELPDAADEPERFRLRLGAEVGRELNALVAQDRQVRLASRRRRYSGGLHGD